MNYHFFLKISVLIGLSFMGILYSFKDNKQAAPELAMKFDLTELKMKAEELSAVANAFKLGKTNVANLKSTLLKTRMAYKRVEFVLAYFYPSFTEAHINGAPLLHTENGGENAILSKPEGLQVLDELIFSAELMAQKSQAFILSKKLEGNIIELKNGANIIVDQGSQMFEAYRQGLLRIFTLGVTGFDTPGSLNAIQESKVALQAIYESCKYFIQPDKCQGKIVDSLFQNGLVLFNAQVDFENFDRLTFLKSCINPLYKHLLLLKNEWGYQTESSHLSARNVNSQSIFEKDFLNPYYFTELKEEEDSPALMALGKSLFKEPIISQNQKMACISCHHPNKAFTDGLPKSNSNVFGKVVLRNSPTLINAVLSDRYFYDLRAFTLEQQVEHVIYNEKEFNTGYGNIIKKLKGKKEYKTAFKTAFGTGEISRVKIVKALSSYITSLVSYNSEFDHYINGENENIKTEVKQGFNLFMGKANCGTCHFPPTFAGLVPPLYQKNESEILGVFENPKHIPLKMDADLGRYNNSVLSEKSWIHKGSFKTSTVRNITLTSPYFHNGAFSTLEEVMDFYNNGGGDGAGLEVINQTLSGDSLHLNPQEVAAVIEFLHALTDSTVLNL
ncbi:cytochrome-c peroxidase [Putridiphycobacter roseus]|uniref:Cytochrome-c peroxidase n=1 Tax=Putridiphycobacter roseus TaxID=2219161 RepID=A0A2W1NA42_9FLAO|nr:cytochrome c peroxidase [Putridiphycobacter roseus]PZE16165.1 cytochrome-c peroxidase [Putridiphycobacter roseus]